MLLTTGFNAVESIEGARTGGLYIKVRKETILAAPLRVLERSWDEISFEAAAEESTGSRRASNFHLGLDRM